MGVGNDKKVKTNYKCAWNQEQFMANVMILAILIERF